MRTWAWANRRRKRKLPRCTSCGERIPRSEPDVILHRVDGTGQGYYHQRCQGAAYIMPMIEPGVWILTHRHVEAEAN